MTAKKETALALPDWWPASEIVALAVSDLIPYAKNARRYTDLDIEEVAASMKHFGWTMPVLIDEDRVLIAGHRRVLAAERLRIETAPGIVAKGWSESMKNAYRIADNKFTIAGEWDDDFLREELSDLKAVGFDMDLTGFHGDELAEIFEGIGESPLGESISDDDECESDGANGANSKPFRKITVHFDCEEDVVRFAKRIGVSVPKRGQSIRYPSRG
jgi:hypothetical protein